MNRRILWLTSWLTSSLAVLAACGGGAADPPPQPLVAQIEPALAEFRPDDELFHVAATLEAVEIVAERDATAIGYRYADGVLSDGEPLGAADGFTFTPADVTFDADELLRQLNADLDHPVISRVEVIGSAGGVVYSARVLSDAGGVLAVDLGPDGTVRSVVPAN